MIIVRGYYEKSTRWEEMKTVEKACEAAGVDVPREVSDFLTRNPVGLKHVWEEICDDDRFSIDIPSGTSSISFRREG